MKNGKKKVLILLPFFDLGGAEKQGFYAAKELKQQGEYDTEIWAFNRSSGNLIPLIEKESIQYKNLNISPNNLNGRLINRLPAYLKFIKLLRRHKFYAIIPFTFHANLISTLCYKFSGVKKVLWFQIAMENHIGVGRIEKTAKIFKPIYASNSLASGEYIKRRHKLTPLHKVHFIPNPFELKGVQFSKEAWLKNLGVNKGEFTFGIVANFYYEKDHLTLLKAVKVLKEKGCSFKLILVGNNKMDSPYLLRVKSYILDEELFDVVKFAGVVKDVPGLIKSIDCAMLTSTTEGSPNALIEYVAYGTPVIVSNIKPNLEIVGEDYSYQFKTGDYVQLADLMEKIMTEILTLKTKVELISKKVKLRYSEEENLKAFLTVLKE